MRLHFKRELVVRILKELSRAHLTDKIGALHWRARLEQPAMQDGAAHRGAERWHRQQLVRWQSQRRACARMAAAARHQAAPVRRHQRRAHAQMAAAARRQPAP